MRPSFVHIVYVVCSASVTMAATPPEAQGQTTVVIGQFEARKQLERSPAPDYPMIAMAAKVTGAVNVDVTIAPDGRVIRTSALGGPPMLVHAAETGVRGWRFRPITSATGEPVTARTVISVLFGPQPDRAALEALVAYGDAVMLCAVAVDAGEMGRGVSLCEKAFDLEAKLVTLHQSHQAAFAYSLALSGSSRHVEAHVVLEQTERSLSRGIWSPAEQAIDHVVRARAERDRGNLRNAAERYEDAWNKWTQARQRVARDSPLRSQTLGYQQQIGPEWADVLDQMGRQRDAERVRARAAALR